MTRHGQHQDTDEDSDGTHGDPVANLPGVSTKVTGATITDDQIRWLRDGKLGLDAHPTTALPTERGGEDPT